MKKVVRNTWVKVKYKVIYFVERNILSGMW